MSDYTIELSSEPINGAMNYKRKFNISGDIGGSGGALVVNVATVDETSTCDKTAGEIYAACPAVIFVSGTTEYMTASPLSAYGFGESGYTFEALSGAEYEAATAEAYPASGNSPK